MDPEVVTAQTALQAAQSNLDNARRRYDDAAQKYDGSSADDPVVLRAASDAMARASVALQSAETEYATSARQLSTAHGNAATRASTPEGKAAYAAQAKSYEADAKLKEAEAAVVGAKSSTDLATAQANLLNAQNSAKRTAAEISTVLPAQAASLNANAAQSLAAAGESAERSRSLIPAQAAAANATAAESNARATQEIPAQVRQAMASAGLSEAQAASLWQQIGLSKQVTQGLDQPTLVFQDPKSGQVSGQQNPGYQAANTRLLQNQQDTITQIQGMLEKGQMSPTEAQSYMDAVRAQTDSAMRGTTPFAEATQRQNYARDAGGVGRDILNNRVSQATSLAQTLIGAIKPSGVEGFDFSSLNPFDLAKGFTSDVGGGQPISDTASSLVQGLRDGGKAGQMVTAPDGLPHDLKWGPISQPLSSYAMPGTPA